MIAIFQIVFGKSTNKGWREAKDLPLTLVINAPTMMQDVYHEKNLNNQFYRSEM